MYLSRYIMVSADNHKTCFQIAVRSEVSQGLDVRLHGCSWYLDYPPQRDLMVPGSETGGWWRNLSGVFRLGKQRFIIWIFIMNR